MRYKRVCKRCHGPISKVNRHGYCFQNETCRILGRRAAYTSHKKEVMNKSIRQLKKEARMAEA